MSSKKLTCIGCPLGCTIHVKLQDGVITNITGHTCKRGEDYAKKKVTHPTRIVTSTVPVVNGQISMVSVKTEQDIPKEKIMAVMADINSIVAQAPISIGDILLANVADTNVNIVATKDVAAL